MKRTKIVCTIGPASEGEEVLRRLIKTGMNAARINFSHLKEDGYLKYEKIIKQIRDLAEKEKKEIAIIGDLQGPRIRLGKLAKDGIKLNKGDLVVLTTDNKRKTSDKIPVTYAELHKDVKTGEVIFLDDGLIRLKILKVFGTSIEARVLSGGTIVSFKGMNFPETELSLSSLTQKDKKDIEFIVKNNLDFIALSFVNKSNDVLELRSLINKIQKKYNQEAQIKIIAKIETKRAIKNFKNILEFADGIMVARGDLGIELKPEEVPVFQKKIIKETLKEAKPVIVATQMMESMMEKTRPLRAEVSDVANAVVDHADAVMLSGETALGKYPVLVVKKMAQIINLSEKSVYDDLNISESVQKIMPEETAISVAAALLAESIKARAILVSSISGQTARLVSRFRPERMILVATNKKVVARQLALSWGVNPVFIESENKPGELIKKLIKVSLEREYIKKNDIVITILGSGAGLQSGIDSIKIEKIK